MKSVRITTYRNNGIKAEGGGFVVIGDNGQLPADVATKDWVIAQEFVSLDQLGEKLAEYVTKESLTLVLGEFWKKDELIRDGLYLKFIEGYIKSKYADEAGNAEHWDHHLFDSYLNQAVKTDSDVQFKSLQSTEFITKIAGWIITALGDSEFRDIIAKSFQTRNFTAGPLGAGVGILNQNELQTDKLLVRKIMYVLEMMIQRMQFQVGEHVLTPGGGFKITKVEITDTYYRVFFDDDKGKIPNYFVVNDQGRIQNYNGGDQKYLWSLVISVGKNYIDLSRVDKDGDGVPAEGDEVVQLGNRDNTDRQDAVLLTAVNGEVGIITYFGINNFDLSGKEGSWFGKHGGKKGCVVRGEIHVEANSFGLANLAEWGDAARDIQEAQAAAEEAKRKAREAQDFIDNVLPGDFASLQAQIDGQIESFFYNYDPTLSNIPASSWMTVAEKDKHLNDTFTNTKTGASWRFTKSGSTHTWTEIADTATKKALQMAGQAQDTADSKRRVFVVTPVPPYETGDLWTQGTSGDLMRCKVSRTSGNHVSSDWEKASKYTDDTTATAAKTKAEEAVQAAATAKSAADAAQGTANTAKTNAESVNIAIGRMSDDNIISSFEKPALKKEWDAIVSEKVLNDAQATRFGVDKTAYGTAYNTLSTFIGTNLNTLTTDWSVAGATLRSTFKNYYDARTTLLNNISYNAKQQAAKAESDAKKAQDKANTLETTVGQQGTLISTLDGKYTAQASQISGLQTKIDAVPGKIEQSVSGVINWTEGKITETKGYADEIVSNVDLGTRNLITNRHNVITSSSDYPDLSSYSSVVNAKGEREITVTCVKLDASWTRAVRYAWYTDKLSEPIIPSFYVLSFDYKCSNRCRVSTSVRNNDGTSIINCIKNFDSTNGKWERGYFLVDWTTVTTQYRTLFAISADAAVLNSTTSYRNLKLVRGNKGWDDSEAPEDVDARVKAAKDAAAIADGKAVKAQGDATALNTKLTGWAADNVISPLEKQAIKETQAAVLSEKNDIVAEAGKYGVSSSAFVTAWTNYNTQLTNHSKATPENIPINSALATTQTAYSTAKVTIRQAIAEAARVYSNTVSQEKVDNLEIGTRNLFPDSAIGWTAQAPTYNFMSRTPSIAIEVGKTYTIVMNGRSTATVGLRAYIAGNQMVASLKSETDTTIMETFVATLTGTVYFYHFPSGSTGTSTLNWIMLFEGNKAPQTWVAAPEDINKQIKDSEAKAIQEAQAKANAAKDAAILAANTASQAKIDLLKTQELANLDGKITAEEKRAIADAQTKYNNAVSEAQKKADAAKKAAIDAAALDASNKIDNIQIGGTNLARYSGGAYLDVLGLYVADRARAVKATIDGRACLQMNNTAANTTIRVGRVDIPEAGTYTLSFWIKGTTAYSCSLVNYNGTGYNGVSINVKTGWSKVVVTFEAKTAYDIVHISAKAETTYITDWKYEKGNKATDWSPSLEDIHAEIDDVSKALGTLDTTINGAFKDGIINKAETDLIKSNINTLNAEKKGIDAGYTTLYNNVYLLSGSTAATNLSAAKIAYNTAHANLISSINTAIADGKATAAEKTDVDAKFNAYGAALANYEDKVEAANRAIQDRVKDVASSDITKDRKFFVGNFDNPGTFGFFLWKTTMPEKNAIMWKVDISGYLYGAETSFGVQLVFYPYTSGLARFGYMITGSSHVDRIRLGVIDGKIAIELKLTENIYYPNFDITISATSGGNKTLLKFYSQGWVESNGTISGGDLLPSTATNVVTVPRYLSHDAVKAQEAAAAADTADKKAQNAASEAGKANTKLADWSSDSKVSPAEKTALKQQQVDIQNEYTEIKNQVTRYALTGSAEWTAYNTAYTNANSALTTYTAATPEFIPIVQATWNNIAAYYPKRQAVLDKIAMAAKAYANTVANDAVDNLQIGSRNLFLNSGKLIKNGSYNIAVYTTTEDLVAGKRYTIALRGTTTGGQRLGAYMNAGNSIVANFKVNMTDEIAYIPFTAIAPNAANIRKIHFYNLSSSGCAANPATIKWAALYEGVVKPPSDWMPAPEDIENDIEVAKSALDSKITTKADSNTVTTIQNDLNAANRVIATHTSQITTNTGGISSVVSRTTTLETWKTSAETRIKQTEDKISLEVVKKDTVLASINASAEGVKIKASQIQLLGAVSFSMLDSSAQSTINGKVTSAQATTIATTQVNTLKNSLGSLAYLSKVEQAQLGTTLIEGGYIKTSLIRADLILSAGAKIGEFEIGDIDGKDRRWLTASNNTMGLSGSQLAFNKSDRTVYIGSHPNEGLGGEPILGYFNIGNITPTLNSLEKCALYAAAPLHYSPLIKSYALYAESGSIVIKNGGFGGTVRSFSLSGSSAIIDCNFLTGSVNSATSGMTVGIRPGFQGQRLALINYSGVRFSICNGDRLSTKIPAECSAILYYTGDQWLPVQVGNLYYA